MIFLIFQDEKYVKIYQKNNLVENINVIIGCEKYYQGNSIRKVKKQLGSEFAILTAD